MRYSKPPVDRPLTGGGRPVVRATAPSVPVVERVAPRISKPPPSAPSTARPIVDRFAPQSSSGTPSQPTDSSNTGGGRVAHDEFAESWVELRSLSTVAEGASFVVGLAQKKMRCTMGIVHTYDADPHEFVLVHAVGPNPSKAIGLRTPDSDPVFAEAVRRSVPMIVEGNDPRVCEGRWVVLEGLPMSIMLCSVVHGGQLVAMMEVAHSNADSSFDESDVAVMAAIAKEFGAFVAGLSA